MTEQRPGGCTCHTLDVLLYGSILGSTWSLGEGGIDAQLQQSISTLSVGAHVARAEKRYPEGIAAIRRLQLQLQAPSRRGGPQAC